MFIFDGLRIRDPRPLNRAELRATAHHEAGHAVAMIVLGYSRPIEFVRVGKHVFNQQVVAGRVHVGDPAVTLDKMTRDELVRYAMVNLAGPLAEFYDQRHRHNPVCGESLDDFMDEGGGSDDRDEAMQACAEIACRDLGLGATVAVGDPWPVAVKASAPNFAHEFQEQARRLVEEHWPHIRKLAIMLQQRGTVTGEEIWSLLTQPDNDNTLDRKEDAA